MRGERKSLFIFLMGLAWKFRFSMPLLLSSTVAMLGRAWMFQIRVQTIQGVHENQRMLFTPEPPEFPRGPRPENLQYYDEEEEEPPDDSTTWDSSSASSWETLAEEEVFG